MYGDRLLSLSRAGDPLAAGCPTRAVVKPVWVTSNWHDCKTLGTTQHLMFPFH